MTDKNNGKLDIEETSKEGLNSGSKTNKATNKKLTKKEIETQVRKSLEDDLISQLDNAGRFTAFHKNLIEDYMFYYDLKEKMKRDINRRGLVITQTTGNGFEKVIINENVAELQKTTRLMLKILQDLGLQDPLEDEEVDFSDFL